MAQTIQNEAIMELEGGYDSNLQEQKIEWLRSIIANLPPRCQDILRLKQEGHKYKEISNLLNISVKTIESQMRIAYKKIKDEFDPALDLFLLLHRRLLPNLS